MNFNLICPYLMLFFQHLSLSIQAPQINRSRRYIEPRAGVEKQKKLSPVVTINKSLMEEIYSIIVRTASPRCVSWCKVYGVAFLVFRYRERIKAAPFDWRFWFISLASLHIRAHKYTHTHTRRIMQMRPLDFSPCARFLNFAHSTQVAVIVSRPSHWSLAKAN